MTIDRATPPSSLPTTPGRRRAIVRASVGVTLFAWTCAATFVSFDTPTAVEFVFVSAGGWTVVAAMGAALVTLVAWLQAGRWARRIAGVAVDDVRDARAMAPFAWLAGIALAPIAALPHVGPRGAWLVFAAYDLRWWWLGAACVMSAVAHLGDVVTSRVRTEPPASRERRRLAADAIVFVSAVSFAWLTTPHLAFSAVVHGDEGKYLRLSETIAQGEGVDVGAKRALDDLPLTASPALGRDVSRIVAALREDAARLPDDLASSLRHPAAFRWNRARSEPAWFLTGRDGRLYEVHTPGLSVLLLPGYLIDRQLLNTEAGYQHEFPARLVATNGVALLLYGLLAVALFRLCRHVGSGRRAAMVWAIIGVTALPLSDFAFQFYPEVAAGLFATVALTGVLFATAGSWIAVGGCGALAGALVWLHPRFLLVALTLVALAAWHRRGADRLAFVLAWIAALGTFSLYTYHLTGSPLPTTLYDAAGTPGAFDVRAVPATLVGMLFDHTWGVVPLAPYLLLVPAAIATIGPGERRAPALAIGLVLLATAIPGAGHGLTAAGATPGRYLAATLPLAAALLAAGRFEWQRATWTIGVAIALGLTVETAVAYNQFHFKDAGPMLEATVSGWRPSLLLPGRDVVMPAGATVNLSFLLALVVATIVAARRAAARHASQGVGRSVRAAVVIVIVLCAGFAADALAGFPTSPDLRMPADVARARLEAAMPERRCTICAASAHGVGARAAGALTDH